MKNEHAAEINEKMNTKVVNEHESKFADCRFWLSKWKTNSVLQCNYGLKQKMSNYNL